MDRLQPLATASCGAGDDEEAKQKGSAASRAFSVWKLRIRLVAMFGPAQRIIGRLVIALGLILSGSGPVLAAPHAMTAMTMMPAMAMDHDMGAAKHAPTKQTPCGSQDCGCCAACPCAPPPYLAQIELLRQAASPDTILVHDDVASGITFPPSLRPPILV